MAPRAMRCVAPTDNSVSHALIADGNQTSVTDPDGNATNFTYNDLDELVGESRYTYESGLATSKALVSESFNYDTAGDLTSETNFDGQTIYCQYDDAGDKTEELWGSQTSPSATFSYTYDDLGNQLTAAGPTGTETLTYNADNEPTSDSFTGNGFSGPVAITNTYDGLGERTTSSLAFNGQADYTNTYGYDGDGNETGVTQIGTAAAMPWRPNTLTWPTDPTASWKAKRAMPARTTAPQSWRPATTTTMPTAT